MRWFKHLTATRRDEKIAAYLDMSRRPMEAYGFWWALLEVVAEQMTKNNLKCEVTYSLPQWSRVLYSHHHSVSNHMSNLQVAGLIEISKVDSKLTVKIPNLLKYRDEYTKKTGQQSGVTTDQLLSKNQITETNNKLSPISSWPHFSDESGWAALGKSIGIEARPGESLSAFINRVKKSRHN